MKKICIVIAVTAVCLAAIFSLFKAHTETIGPKKEAFDAFEKDIRADISAFQGIAGVVIKDLRNGWTISVNADERIPSASLVKVPVMAACYYASREGALDLNEKVRLTESDKVSGSGILKTKPAGMQYSIKQLVDIMITQSDNTASNILIKRLGFKYLNTVFKKMGLDNTNIDRLMMDFKTRKQGVENYTTAGDMAFMLERIYRKKLITGGISATCLTLLKRQKIKDRIPRELPDDIVVAHKTGLERGVCHDVGIVYTQNGDFLISILVKHSDKTSSRAKRFISALSLKTFRYVTQE